jgi:hypothetical protein
MNVWNNLPWPEHRHQDSTKLPALFFFVAVLVILFLALPVSVDAEDRGMVNYTLIDENSVSLRDFTGLKESHFGLSKGMVAYHKDQTIYTWDSRTGERRTLEIPPVSNYYTKIQSLDITDGKVYYVFHKTKVKTFRGSEGGVYVFDGKNNTPLASFSRHDILTSSQTITASSSTMQQIIISPWIP